MSPEPPTIVVHLGEWGHGNVWFLGPTTGYLVVYPNARDLLRLLTDVTRPRWDIECCWDCEDHEMPCKDSTEGRWQRWGNNGVVWRERFTDPGGQRP